MSVAPRLSFIVPAHDEEAQVVGAIQAIQESATACGEPFELLVVDDGSSDATAARAEAAGARVLRVSLRQIAAVRNAGAAEAKGDRFFFVDADTRVTPGVVRAALEALDDGAVGGGAAVRFDEPTPRYAKALLATLLWVNRRLRLASGCFIFCTREAFESIGGFDRTLFAAEEVAISRALGRRGPFVLLGAKVTTSGRKLRSHSAGELFGTLAKLTLLGRRGVRDRRHLALWYGRRPPDPGTTAGP